MEFFYKLLFALVTGIISRVIATYIVRVLDSLRHKKNRQES